MDNRVWKAFEILFLVSAARGDDLLYKYISFDARNIRTWRISVAPTKAVEKANH
jgi:hypothetical protein